MATKRLSFNYKLQTERLAIISSSCSGSCPKKESIVLPIVFPLCGPCSSIAIKLVDSAKVMQPICIDTEEPQKVILGKLVEKVSLSDSTGCPANEFRYTIDYDDAQLTNPEVELDICDIDGFDCFGPTGEYLLNRGLCEDFVNVKAYGARGDGVTNDTAAFQAALATCSSIYVPSGVYLIGETLSIGCKGQKVFGEGNGTETSVLRFTDNTLDGISLDADFTGLDNIRLEGTNISPLAADIAAIRINGADNTLITSVVFSGNGALDGFVNGIYITDNSNYPIIQNCHFDKLWGTIANPGVFGTAVYIENITGGNISNNSFIATANRGKKGVRIDGGATGLVIATNYFTGWDGSAVMMNNTAPDPKPVGTKVLNNFIKSCGVAGWSGILLTGRSADFLIQGNTVQLSGGNGIQVIGGIAAAGDSTHTIISENSIRDCQYVGIYIAETYDTLVQGNVILECSRVSAGTYANIVLTSSALLAPTGTMFIGNRSLGTTFSKAPIELAASAPVPTDTRLTGNYFPPGLVSGPIFNTAIVRQDNCILASTALNPGVINNGTAPANWSLAVPGAEVGDQVSVTLDTADMDRFIGYGYVNAAGNVKFTFANLGAAPFDIVSTTAYISVFKRTA